jgi:hypothetical protein
MTAKHGDVGRRQRAAQLTGQQQQRTGRAHQWIEPDADELERAFRQRIGTRRRRHERPHR